MTEGQLADKVILMAGGGGIGSGCVKRYVEDGASVVLGDINGDAARASAAQIDPSGKHVVGVALDGTDDASVAASVAEAMSRFGRLDGMHVNFANFADGLVPEGVVDIAMELYDEMFDVNVRGFVLCTRHAVPAMIRGGGGSIVYTSSGAAYSGDPVRPFYAMSKAAQHALMRHVARRYGPDGIRANIIAPGIITHPKLDATMTPERRAMYLKGTLMRSRLGNPNDIASVASLLLSDNGGFITAQAISVDGGATMRA